MSSPAKKRKLNNAAKNEKPPPKGLEYFFSKQKQNGDGYSAAPRSPQREPDDAPLTDEELARKLQAEWDKEAMQLNIQESDGVEISAKSDVGGAGDPGNSADQQTDAPELPAPVTIFGGKKTLALQSAGMEEDGVTISLPLDESPLIFEPSKYVEQLKQHWSRDDGSASYALLTRCFVLVSGTASRIKIVDTLVNCLRILIEGDPESLLPAVWLATNSISPAYISMELGLGGSAISKALKQVCGLDSRSLKMLYDKYGDAGDVAFEAKKKQSFTLRKPKPLSIKGVYRSLSKIATTQGQGSNEVKQRIVDRLLQDARGGEESRFIVRTLCQHLRIGAVKTTMLIALSRAFLLSKPAIAEYDVRNKSLLAKSKKEELAEVWAKAEEIVKACFAKRPNYNDLIPNLLEIGVCEELLIRCGLALHIPLRPMLGSITRDLFEMLTKLQGRDFTCEYKYDGQRAQVHCDEGGKVSIFSRHLELMTDKYPDLVELVPKIRGDGVSSFIMEGEVVAVDSASGELKNFQALTNRARKDVEIGSITVQSLLNRSFRERRELLRSLFTEVPNRFTWVKSLDATSTESETVLDFFKSATESKCEGIMVKILDNLPDIAYLGGEEGEMKEEEPKLQMPKGRSKSKGSKKSDEAESNEPPKKRSRRKALLATYEPDKRLDSWLKVKKDYSSSFDTLDLIPIAGWHGQGRKAKWWSPILLAVRNEESGTLEAVCKCISGFTDAFYKANKSFYNDGSETGEPKNTRLQMPSFVEYSGPMPDVWFEPQEVWEMAFADITLSPTYTAAIGLVSDERGLSLRFPRFLKKRDDKSLEEASTNEFLAGLWRKQEASASTSSRANPVEADEDAE
ncbi:DNA ligase, ATP-dependent [Cordyceps fumosorosea ARSEF 2679]|uniref:DNA ligase, ATP-dependent n=1 Tax=Cordyceps fumosorosea (strain ARSEF 2679) TaxID=1081104 RepID=A0A167NXD9_CORFA|nr:DNA ligase, ATP-dependent [Cordyceps fumosorosea ARSEF 2679]OAA56053.1 DNA ligase, ATP-dependent [Cordyceps fumosorosea ARSEF 2679]